MFEDPNVDAIVAGTMVTRGWIEFKDNSFFAEASRRHPEKPIVAFATSEWELVNELQEDLEKQRIPTYTSPEMAAKALSTMYKYSCIKSS